MNFTPAGSLSVSPWLRTINELRTFNKSLLKNKNNKWSIDVSSFFSVMLMRTMKNFEKLMTKKIESLNFPKRRRTNIYYLPWARHSRSRFFIENLSNLSICQKKGKALRTWRTCWELPSSQMQISYLKRQSIEIASPFTQRQLQCSISTYCSGT